MRITLAGETPVTGAYMLGAPVTGIKGLGRQY